MTFDYVVADSKNIVISAKVPVQLFDRIVCSEELKSIFLVICSLRKFPISLLYIQCLTKRKFLVSIN